MTKYMKCFGMLMIAMFFLSSCQNEVEISSVDPVNWEKRMANASALDSLVEGTTYLSVYAQIYSETEHRTHNLTSTISMRNTDRTDSLFIQNCEYFDTHGASVRKYFDKPIFIAPMETVEIVIDETNQEGGTGGNFIFDWKIQPDSNEPLFEGVMISTSGQQGLSFSTIGIRVK